MKNKLKNLILILIITLTLIGCVRHEPEFLPANYLYKGSYMHIHSPNQEGWSLIKHDNTQIIFGKKTEKYNESYIARVVFFPLEDTKTDEEFFNLIKKSIKGKTTNKNRFVSLKSKYTLSKQRSYPCVIAEELLQDKEATTAKGNKEALQMQVKSLYCKDPKRKDTPAGFMVGYSYRGDSINQNFNTEADNFIDGVRFPIHN